MTALATLDDVNTFLPQDKLMQEDGDSGFQRALLDSQRIVIGQLATHIPPTTIAVWADPTTTPDVIRSVLGRLTAALIYARQFSNRTGEVPEYAQMLYDQAMMMIAQILAGTLDIGETVDVGFSDLRFWPNNTTEAPKFTMDLDFA